MWNTNKFFKKTLPFLGLAVIAVLAVSFLSGCGTNSEEEDLEANINEEEVTTPVANEALNANQNLEATQPAVEEVNIDDEVKQLDAAVGGVNAEDFNESGLANKELGI